MGLRTRLLVEFESQMVERRLNEKAKRLVVPLQRFVLFFFLVGDTHIEKANVDKAICQEGKWQSRRWWFVMTRRICVLFMYLRSFQKYSHSTLKGTCVKKISENTVSTPSLSSFFHLHVKVRAQFLKCAYRQCTWKRCKKVRSTNIFCN